MKLGLSQYIAVCLLAGGFGLARNASAQQQFGPSPQAMYKQHPGSAPTFTNYGAPALTAKISSPSTLVGQQTVSTRTPSRPAVRPTATTRRKASTTAVPSRH